MYKNPKEIAAHKKRLPFKVVVPKKKFPQRLLGLVAGNSFFQGTVFRYFTKVAAAIHSSMVRVFFKRALAAMNFVYTMQVFERYWVNSQFQLQAPI